MNGKIIDPQKSNRQDLQDEFVRRLNALAQNAFWRGLTQMEVVGILDTMKFGIQAQSVNLTRQPAAEEKK